MSRFFVIVGFVSANVCLIHYVVTHLLILENFNLGQVSQIDVVITWLLANENGIN